MVSHRHLSVGIAVSLLAAAPIAQAEITYFGDLSTFSSGRLITVIEDFETIAPLNKAISSFSHNGNTFVGLAGVSDVVPNTAFPNVYLAPVDTNNFATPPTTSVVLTANGDEDFTLNFGVSRRSVGFVTYTIDFGPTTIRIYGSQGLLDTFTLVQDSSKVGFFGVVSSEAITSIRWTTVDGGLVNTGVDNIRVGSPVPEPGTSVLLLSGVLMGGGLMLRRRWQ